MKRVKIAVPSGIRLYWAVIIVALLANPIVWYLLKEREARTVVIFTVGAVLAQLLTLLLLRSSILAKRHADREGDEGQRREAKRELVRQSIAQIAQATMLTVALMVWFAWRTDIVVLLLAYLPWIAAARQAVDVGNRIKDVERWHDRYG